MHGGHCPACGAPLRLVWVHGHGQCAACGVNVAPCCSGAGDEVDAFDSVPADGGLQTLLALLEESGPQLAADLCNRFAQRTGCDVALGHRLIDQALRAGEVQRSAAGVLSVAR